MTNSLQWKPTALHLRLLLGVLGVGFTAIGMVIFARFPFWRAMRVGALVTIGVGVAGLVLALRDQRG